MNAALCSMLVLAIISAGCLDLGPRRLADCEPAPDPGSAPTTFPGQTLRILDHGSFSALAAVKHIFENQTGARIVQIEAADAGQALQQALLGAGNPPADVLYGVDNALFFAEDVLDHCLFEPYESSNLERINRTLVDVDQFRVDGRLWTTPVDFGFVSVNYDIRLTQGGAQPPTSLRDLAKPEWARQFVTEDPRESSPGLGFLIATIDTFGETGDYTWRDYWSELLDNGALVVPDWTTAYVYHYSGGYGAGDKANKADRRLVTSYTTSPAVEVYFGADSVPGVSFEPPYGVFHQVETMGILRGTPVPHLAQAWIDFTLTPAFQKTTAPEMAVYPVIDGVDIPQAFHDHATDPSELRSARFSARQIGENLDRWLDEWEDLYQAAQS